MKKKEFYTQVFLVFLFLAYFTSHALSSELLTQKERDYLSSKKSIVFVSQTSYPPFEFVGKKGERAGMSIELARWMGFQFEFKTKFIDMAFKDAQEAVLSGKADVLTSFFYSKKRDRYFDFTDTAFKVPASIFVSIDRPDIRGLKDLNGKTLAMQQGDYAIEFLESNNISSKVMFTSDFAEATNLVIHKKADAIIGDEQIVLYHLYSNNLNKYIKKVGEPLYTGENCMSVKEDNEILQSILNKGLLLANQKGVLGQINKKWLGAKIPIQHSFFSKYVYHISGIFAVIALIALFVWFSNIRLRRQVEKRTHDLFESKEELKKSEEQYREYFEENFSGAYISTPEGRLIVCNQEYKNIFGFDNTQHALHTVIQDLFENSNDRAKFLSLLKKEKQVSGYEYILKRVDGTPINVVENATGVFDKDGKLERIRGFLLDVTGQRTLEMKLHQSQKMEAIGTLAGGIAHDFNNILFPILGYTEMLLQDIGEDSPFKDSLNHIYSGAMRARDLVSQILTFSRQEKCELRPMKIQFAMKEALKLIRSSIPTSIDINHDISPDCGAVNADPTQIHQIIMNLATNAYHAMEKTGGQLTVSLQEVELEANDHLPHGVLPGTYAFLVVSDTGTGMTSDLLQKIFDPFFTTKEQGKGSGMGLSMIHGIVKQMGGSIQVISEFGTGTEVKVYFPILGHHIKEENTHSETLLCGTEHILLVDDEEDIVQMERKILERVGYTVTSRLCGIEALEAFRVSPDKFDLVITDMAMPRLSGDKLAAGLIKIRPDIPILLCTGFSEIMSEEKAVSLGIKGFLMKPVIVKDLTQKIRELLGT